MEQSIYLWMALIGSGLLLVQVVLQVIGLEHDTDGVDVHVDVDAHGDFHGDVEGHGNVFFGVLSFKALVAFAAVFGLMGLTLLEHTDLGQPLRLVYSTLAGAGAMLMVAWLMRLLHSLSSSGSVKLANTVGREGSCYLRIPARSEGQGKVSLDVQGRSIELRAVTDGDEIPTGRRVRVVELLGDESVKVVSL